MTQAEVRQRWRFTVDDFHRMGEAGILGEDDRVELVEGELVEMAPIGARHAAYLNELVRLVHERVGRRVIVQPQGPLGLSERTEVYPDLALLRWREDHYVSTIPTPRDTLLVVEVSDTTLAYDRDGKAPLYAAAGVPEVWIVDLAGSRIDVHRTPGPDGYAEIRAFGPGEEVAPLLLPELALQVREILI